MKRILLLSLLTSSAVIAAPFGEQISESGIKHSFLVTGTKTCIVGEDGEISWEIGTASRLTNGNKTVVFDEEGKVAWVATNADVAGRFAEGGAWWSEVELLKAGRGSATGEGKCATLGSRRFLEATETVTLLWEGPVTGTDHAT